MDPLSDVLSLLKPSRQLYAGFDAAGEWSFAFPAQEEIKFAAIMHGRCWGYVEGLTKPLRLNEGDCFLLTSGRRFVLTTDPALSPVEAPSIFETSRDGIAFWNGGGDLFLVSGRFAFSGDYATSLFAALPPIVHVPQASSQAEVLRWSLDQLASELLHQQLGGVLMATHLTHVMLVQVLRLYLATPISGNVGWFFALSDPQIGVAINAVHAHPARRWTLEELARVAGMSRSVFAERFKQLVGRGAIEYLTRWRMLLAADRLRESIESVASIAFSLGYESESSFSTAFKRTMSCSPMQYRRKISMTKAVRNFDGVEENRQAA